jgi:hypothetical protein
MNLISRVALALLLAGVAGRTFAANAPGPGYKLSESKDDIFVSPDKTLRVEQYVKTTSPDGDLRWQFWVFDKDHKHGCLLNAKPMDDYSAGFRFSPDSQWLVRMQKTGAGWATLYLYHRNGLDFTEATREPLGDMAWSYYDSVRKKLKLPDTSDDDHLTVDLIKGYEENYHWLGYKWPAGRYLVIGLFSGKLLHGFWCLYDTQTGKFSSPADLDAKRAAAEKDTPRIQGG